jgi:DNA-binding HxlR family transcriptional regulator
MLPVYSTVRQRAIRHKKVTGACENFKGREAENVRIEECNVSTALEVIGGKWKPLILWTLKQGPHRFSELRRKVPGASQKVMTEQLRQLERSGIVERRALPGVRAHTEYRLSPYGVTLRPALLALAEWGARHRKRPES